MSRTKWILALVGVVIVVVILWRVFAGDGKPQRPDGSGAEAAVPVTVVPVAARNVPVYLGNSGTVTPINMVNVQPQVGGQLLELNFEEGKPVKKGQLLARIDPRSLQAQLAQATAKRAQDRTQLATAKANLERSQNPKYRQYVSEIDRITQKNTVAANQAAVAADNAAIDNIQVQLGFTKIESPIDGVAGIRQVDPGNVVTTGTTIVTVTQMHPIDVVFTLAGKYLDQVRSAQAKAPLHVAVLDAQGKVVEDDGLLTVINNQIDPDTGSFKLKARFPNPENQLFPGQYVPVRLEVSVDAGALVVPTAAVQRGPHGDYVWLVTDKPPPDSGDDAHTKTAPPKAKAGQQAAPDKPEKNAKPPKYVRMQDVTTGGEAGDTGLIILSGLKAGDLVVTAGQFRLKQGAKVLPLKPGEVPAPPTTTEMKAASQKGGRRGR